MDLEQKVERLDSDLTKFRARFDEVITTIKAEQKRNTEINENNNKHFRQMRTDFQEMNSNVKQLVDAVKGSDYNKKGILGEVDIAKQEIDKLKEDLLTLKLQYGINLAWTKGLSILIVVPLIRIVYDIVKSM